MENIIITGSSNGFGLKAAKDFADKGNKVFATMRNPGGKNAGAKAELESYSTNIKVVDMDVTNDASVKEAMSTILAEAGNIDILINNAGIVTSRSRSGRSMIFDYQHPRYPISQAKYIKTS
jgi:NAD(P)-dependent dehydrogenase (short-subunit alcohol dehydrogenase family)